MLCWLPVGDQVVANMEAWADVFGLAAWETAMHYQLVDHYKFFPLQSFAFRNSQEERINMKIDTLSSFSCSTSTKAK